MEVALSPPPPRQSQTPQSTPYTPYTTRPSSTPSPPPTYNAYAQPPPSQAPNTYTYTYAPQSTQTRPSHAYDALPQPRQQHVFYTQNRDGTFTPQVWDPRPEDARYSALQFEMRDGSRAFLDTSGGGGQRDAGQRRAQGYAVSAEERQQRGYEQEFLPPAGPPPQRRMSEKGYYVSEGGDGGLFGVSLIEPLHPVPFRCIDIRAILDEELTGTADARPSPRQATSTSR